MTKNLNHNVSAPNNTFATQHNSRHDIIAVASSFPLYAKAVKATFKLLFMGEKLAQQNVHLLVGGVECKPWCVFALQVFQVQHKHQPEERPADFCVLLFSLCVFFIIAERAEQREHKAFLIYMFWWKWNIWIEPTYKKNEKRLFARYRKQLLDRSIQAKQKRLPFFMMYELIKCVVILLILYDTIKDHSN